MVEIPTDSGEIEAFRAYPQTAAKPAAGSVLLPAVIVVHEIFGLHAYIRDICLRLAREGFLAVAPDLYGRYGDVSELETVGAILEQVVERVRDDRVMADLDATLAWVAAGGIGDPARAGITGFCWGGRIVWLYAAHSRKLRAAVAWYGRLVGDRRPETPTHPLDLVTELHAPVLGLYGSEDAGIPVETVRRMRTRLAAGHRASEIVIFPAAGHGFHADYRSSYRALAAAEAWRRALAWFRMHGVR